MEKVLISKTSINEIKDKLEKTNTVNAQLLTRIHTLEQQLAVPEKKIPIHDDSHLTKRIIELKQQLSKTQNEIHLMYKQKLNQLELDLLREKIKNKELQSRVAELDTENHDIKDKVKHVLGKSLKVVELFKGNRDTQQSELCGMASLINQL
ncbi:hypothetical protein HDV01_003601 [Terramyces sp. JEL0728]|nr:hypothetical protein HDV01_003601 [Terramyces sp. JEL0728]